MTSDHLKETGSFFSRELFTQLILSISFTILHDTRHNQQRWSAATNSNASAYHLIDFIHYVYIVGLCHPTLAKDDVDVKKSVSNFRSFEISLEVNNGTARYGRKINCFFINFVGLNLEL